MLLRMVVLVERDLAKDRLARDAGNERLCAANHFALLLDLHERPRGQKVHLLRAKFRAGPHWHLASSLPLRIIFGTLDDRLLQVLFAVCISKHHPTPHARPRLCDLELVERAILSPELCPTLHSRIDEALIVQNCHTVAWQVAEGSTRDGHLWRRVDSNLSGLALEVVPPHHDTVPLVL
eukprot:2944016-Prymnesium_polylepis.1